MPKFEYNFPDEQFNLISGSSVAQTFGNLPTQYAKLSVYDEFDTFEAEFIAEQDTFSAGTSFVYSGSNGIFVNPNNTLQEYNKLKAGTYNLKFDFLDRTDLASTYTFHIKEIAPSRKEIRIIVRDLAGNPIHASEGTQLALESAFSDTLDSTDNGYLYDFVLTLSEGRSITILNYAFDTLAETIENAGTLVLRLRQPLFNDIVAFNKVHIEHEVLTTQTQEIFFIPDPKYGVISGG